MQGGYSIFFVIFAKSKNHREKVKNYNVNRCKRANVSLKKSLYGKKTLGFRGGCYTFRYPLADKKVEYITFEVFGEGILYPTNSSLAASAIPRSIKSEVLEWNERLPETQEDFGRSRTVFFKLFSHPENFSLIFKNCRKNN